MALEVVHTQGRRVQRESQPAGGGRANQKRASQAGSSRVGNRVDVARRKIGRVKHLSGQWQYASNMVTRREFGHHAAVPLVHAHL